MTRLNRIYSHFRHQPDDKKNKLSLTPNKYAALSGDIGSLPEVFSPPPVTESSSDLKENWNETINRVINH